jgi:hypothetical protein
MGTKIQNNFTSAIVDRDTDERILPDSIMIDAENFLVSTSNGQNGGVGKNVAGTAKKTDYQIAGAKTIGKGVNSATEKVYNFISGTTYDQIIEYDIKTNTSVIVAKSSVGQLLNFNPNKRILNVDIVPNPEGEGDLMFFSGDDNPPRALNIETAKTWTVDGFSEEEISLIKAPPTYPPVLTPLTSTQNPQSNFLEDRFTSFCYRYKFADGYYSAFSSWTEYFFTPGLYNIDFETFENLGMLNIHNAVNITFNTGSREVVGIELIFKLSNSSIPYLIERFNKSKEGWGNFQTQTIEFNNSKVYYALPESEYFKSYDNVPLKALSQTLIGNRIAFANYLEQRDMVDILGNKCLIDYTLELVTRNISSEELDITTATEEYDYGGIDVSLVDGSMSVDFSNVQFLNGSSINILFRLKSNVQDTDFRSTFIYILIDDFTDLADFIANSTFITELNNYISYFEANGGVIFPDDYVPPYVVEQGFDAVVVGDSLKITFPVIKYEIDQTPDPNTFLYEYFYDNNSSVLANNIAVATSLKSYRSYEVCMIYIDEQVRKTTALTSQNNTIFIPNENSITQNQIKVTIPSTQKPPAWAKTYKFGLKRNKQPFETIPINLFFEDGIFRWMKIDGENTNKFKKGDILIVKRDKNGPLANVVKVKVLEFREQDANFITTNATTIVEPSGLYAKIKVTNFNMQYNDNEFVRYQQNRSALDDRPFAYIGDFSTTDDLGNTIDAPFRQGATISFDISSNYHGEPPFVEYVKTFTAQRAYDNFEEFYTEQIEPAGFISTNYPDRGYNFQLVRGIPTTITVLGQTIITGITPNPAGRLWLIIEGTEAGNGTTRRGFIDATVDVRFVSGLYVFETTPIDVNANDQVFFETPEVYTITDGQHEFTEHILTKTFDCYCQGNGVESFQIRDAFNEKKLAIDFCPTAVSEDEYKQINRFADITYSGVFNSNTNINQLNSFNLSEGNFKDDIEKTYGPIYKLKGQDNNLEVYQEDKCSVVYYGKDLLYNADGTTNLSRIQEVLGQQDPDGGEYGISTHPDSFDDYAFNTYFTDVKRGVVIKKNFNNGLFEASSQRMTNYFKRLFEIGSITHINGKYDQYNDFYILNVQYGEGEYVTWVYSDRDNGWLGRLKFNPEDMCRVNKHFVSFKNGEIYLHNQENIRNTFYGVESDSEFSFYFSQEPSTRKSFKNIEIEGTIAPDVTLQTDNDTGYIRKEDFEKKEGDFFYAHVRIQNEVIDTRRLSSQGIGNCTIVGAVLSFTFDLDEIISVGDIVYNENMQIVGTIIDKSARTLTLNAVANIVDNDYVLCQKPQSIQNDDLMGRYMKVTCKFRSNQLQEIFAVNSVVSKSFP